MANKMVKALAGGILTVMLAGCAEQPHWQRAEGGVWNTTYSITYRSPRALDDSIAACFGEVDRSVSVFNPASAISAINRGESDVTDRHIDSLFTLSQQISRASGGMFDPTVGPLVNLWGFGTDRHRRATADGKDGADFSVEQWQVDSALALVGIDRCAIENGRMRKKHKLTAFNFSAIAKGYGCDLVAAMLRRNGVEDFMVEIGGEMALGGSRPNGQPWTVAIDMPEPDGKDAGFYTTVKLTDCGVATSGNYRNYHTSASEGRFGHTISPVTGRPVQTAVVSATVIAPTAAEADGWATACMAMGMPAALEAINAAPGVEAMLITAPGLEAVTSAGWRE